MVQPIDEDTDSVASVYQKCLFACLAGCGKTRLRPKSQRVQHNKRFDSLNVRVRKARKNRFSAAC